MATIVCIRQLNNKDNKNFRIFLGLKKDVLTVGTMVSSCRLLLRIECCNEFQCPVNQLQQ